MWLLCVCAQVPSIHPQHTHTHIMHQLGRQGDTGGPRVAGTPGGGHMTTRHTHSATWYVFSLASTLL